MRPSIFPPVEQADSDGFLCWGGDYSVETLLDAYSHGIFPWPDDPGIPLWFAPPQRAILPLDELHISRKLKQQARQTNWTTHIDRDFRAVIAACAAPRNYTDLTWIFDDLQNAFIEFHESGFAHSFEVYDENDALIGGLYGVSIGGYFAGESMFHRETGASKIAVLALCKYLQEHGATWLDCQTLTPLFASFGAREIARDEFLEMLRSAQNAPKLFG